MEENKQNANGQAPAAPAAAPEQTAETLAEQARIRREKLAKLQGEGKNPYEQVKYPVDADSASVKANFEAYEGKTVTMAGRMMSRRIMGKASFSHIADKSGSIQIYVTRQDIGEENYLSYKKDYDIGDIFGFKGFVFKTQTGEVTVHVTELVLLTKSLLPLPEKYNGLQDKDMKYRLRHLDLIMNDDVKQTFRLRSKIMKELRAYLDAKGYLEVDTPVLLPLEIGADARPFKTHHNALNIDMYMRIETELFLKRLIVGGLDRVYEVGRIFRNEGMDAFHNPEFTTIEMYQAYTDYKGMMDLIEDMYKTVTQNVCGSLDITYQGTEIHMGEWTRLTMAEAVEKYAGVRYDDWKTDEEARAAADEGFVVVAVAFRHPCLDLAEELAQRQRAWNFPAAKNPPKATCSSISSTRSWKKILSSPRLFTITPLKILRLPSARRRIPHLRSVSNISSAGTNTVTRSRNSTIPSISWHACRSRSTRSARRAIFRRRWTRTSSTPSNTACPPRAA